MTGWKWSVVALAGVAFAVSAAFVVTAHADGPAVIEPAPKEGIPPRPRSLGFGTEVKVHLNVTPFAHTGPCPAVFTLKGQIYVNKAATVLYRFVRSDGKLMKPVVLTFEKPGALDVTDTFVIDGGPTASEGWAYIEAIRPVNVKTQSNTVFFNARCGERLRGGPAEIKGDLQEDCVSFDPAGTTAYQERNIWKVGDKVHALFSFGVDKIEAENARDIIAHYRMNKSCFVGRPHASFHYMLVGDAAPAGPFKGEACRPFDPAAVSVGRFNNRWGLRDDKRTLVDFGDRKDDADRALAIIGKYGFTHLCVMAAGKVDFLYLRK